MIGILHLIILLRQIMVCNRMVKRAIPLNNSRCTPKPTLYLTILPLIIKEISNRLTKDLLPNLALSDILRQPNRRCNPYSEVHNRLMDSNTNQYRIIHSTNSNTDNILLDHTAIHIPKPSQVCSMEHPR